MVPFLEPGNFRFSGSVDITVTAKKDTSVNPMHPITMHAHKDLNVTSVTITDIDSQTVVEVVGTERVETREFLVVQLKESLTVDKKYLMSLEFEGPLRKDNYGFYLSSYAVDGGYE